MQGKYPVAPELPAEKHSDFIFTNAGRGIRLWSAVFPAGPLCADHVFCVAAALINKEPFLVAAPFGIRDELLFCSCAVNMSMVIGCGPGCRCARARVSYGGIAMLVLLLPFGLVSLGACHRPR